MVTTPLCMFDLTVLLQKCTAGFFLLSYRKMEMSGAKFRSFGTLNLILLSI